MNLSILDVNIYELNIKICLGNDLHIIRIIQLIYKIRVVQSAKLGTLDRS